MKATGMDRICFTLNTSSLLETDKWVTQTEQMNARHLWEQHKEIVQIMTLLSPLNVVKLNF